MKRASDLIPWKVTDISLRPYKGMWSMNPSIHFDGDLWRCVLRCADYCMKNGETLRSFRAVPGETQTKSAMAILDPDSWRPLEIYKMRERDSLPRAPCASVGYEDVRIFRTDQGGLQGIGASLHLERETGQRNELAEQVLLSFDAEYNIVEARPLRGDWSTKAQKNWAPFDNCTEPRFLYSISDGTLLDAQGCLDPGDAFVRPSTGAQVAAFASPGERALKRARGRAARNAQAREIRRGTSEYRRGLPGRGAHSSVFSYVPRLGHDLRGGTQLIGLKNGTWLGIGHAMDFVNSKKLYWHVWYLVDARGKMLAASAPMKFAPNGIEFAAGLAIVGERVVVSFGVDDMECKIAETRLTDVLELLQKIGTET